MTIKQKDLVYWCLVALIAAIALHTYNAEADDLCRPIHDVSYLIMELRQGGATITETMDTLEGNLEFIVLDAYSQPLEHMERYKEEAATEFANKHYLECRELIE